MAAEEINAKGGVQVGKEKMKIELVKADSNEFLNVTDATNAMERLITSDKVDFIVGGFRTEAVLAMQDIAMDNKKIFMGAGAAHPELCLRVAKDYNRYKYFFRVTPFNSTYLVRTSFAHLGLCRSDPEKGIEPAHGKSGHRGREGRLGGSHDRGRQGGDPQDGHGDGRDLAAFRRRHGCDRGAFGYSEERGQYDLYRFFILGGDSLRPAGRRTQNTGRPGGDQCGSPKGRFMEATKGMGNYVLTTDTYIQGVEYNDLTKPFMDTYVKRFKETPTYTADTYTAIVYALVPSIEAVGSLDADKIVAHLENREYQVPAGKVKYLRTRRGTTPMI